MRTRITKMYINRYKFIFKKLAMVAKIIIVLAYNKTTMSMGELC